MLETSREQFRRIFGKEPHDYQLRVAAVLASGRNVLLRAPTGAGKTEAALFPVLVPPRADFPRRLLYVAPMRILVHELARRCQATASARTVRVQTGDEPDDPCFEADATFTTIDQALSSFLHVPYALTRSRANVNAGAVVGSYLVIDEFHLLDPDASLATTFEMLRLCQLSTPFVLMTATCSDALAKDLAHQLGAKLVSPTTDELATMHSQQKVRRWRRVEEPISAEAVLQAHQGLRLGRRRSIAICNTVERAQRLFLELRERLRGEGSHPRPLLLHSRFTREDRERREQDALALFGKDAGPDADAVLIATQVIEVGLDISCEVLHTELAPATALIQRAGRCARREREEGTVYVYDLPRNEQGKRNFAPYQDDLPGDTLPQLIERTWERLSGLPGDHVGWEAEGDLVKKVQEDTDRNVVRHMQASDTRTRMGSVIAAGAYGDMRRLVRRDDSVTVIVCKQPEKLSKPHAVEGFSLFHGTVRGWLGRAPEGVPWLLKAAAPQDMAGETEIAGQAPTWEWRPATSPQGIAPGRTLAVHPAAVRYDGEVGLRFESSDGAWESPAAPGRERPHERYSYRLEPYVDHVRRAIEAYEAHHRAHVGVVAARMEPRWWPEGELDRACRIAIALHDAGKLTVKWQQWAHEWQRAKESPVSHDLLLAHTDYDPEHDRDRALSSIQRPHHAVEGAVAVSPWLRELLPEILGQVVMNAIARHHAPAARDCQPFELHPGAAQVLKDALRAARIEASPARTLYAARTAKSLRDDDLLPQGELNVQLLAYNMVVRALRMADWAGTASMR